MRWGRAVALSALVVALALLIFMVPRLVDDTRALSAQLPMLLEKNVQGSSPAKTKIE